MSKNPGNWFREPGRKSPATGNVFILLALFALPCIASGGELGIDDAKEAMKRAEEQAQSMQIPGNEHQVTGEQKAGGISGVYQSKEYQENLKTETERVKKELFQGYLPPEKENPSNAVRERGTGGPFLASNERIYLFISSSMPLTALRAYARDIARIGNPGSVYMVLRGFVGGFGDFNATRAFAQGFIDKAHPVNLIIDPLAFRKYGIDSVPAVVYAHGVNPMEGIECVAGQENGGEFWTAYGDAPLKESLGHINLEANSETIQRILAEDL